MENEQDVIEAAWQEYEQSPEGKCKLTTEEALAEIKRVLNTHGWFPDLNNDWEFTMFEVERILMEYLERYTP